MVKGGKMQLSLFQKIARYSAGLWEGQSTNGGSVWMGRKSNHTGKGPTAFPDVSEQSDLTGMQSEVCGAIAFTAL